MTGETDDAVVTGEASAEQTRFETNKPEPYCLFCASRTGCKFLRKHTSFFMVNIVVTVIRNFNHGLNRRSRELTIQVV